MPTDNYAIDLLGDDKAYADETWCQLLAYLLSSPLGNFLKEGAIGGVISGLTLGGTGTSTATVAAGTALVNGCMVKTTEATTLTGLTNSATNYIYAETDSTSHQDDRTVAFTASLSAANPANTIRLGSVTLDSGGSVTAVDDNPTAYPRDLFAPLRCRKVQGTEDEVVAVGTEEVFEIDHSDEVTFSTNRPSTVRIVSADAGVYARTQIIDGSTFYLYIRNDWEEGDDYGYPEYGETGYGDADYVRVVWERSGYVE